MDARVSEIRTHPTPGEPGVAHSRILVEADGLQGDRRKRAAVHLIAAAQSQGVRANFILEASVDDLDAMAERELHVGEAVLRVLGPAGNCGGVYAEVITPGLVRVGDRAADPVEPADRL